MEAVLVVEAEAAGEPSIIFTACADGNVLRWELDTDLNADSYKYACKGLAWFGHDESSADQAHDKHISDTKLLHFTFCSSLLWFHCMSCCLDEALHLSRCWQSLLADVP